MTDMFLLSDGLMARISPFFALSYGMPRVDHRRVISGIIFVIRNGLRWRDVPVDYGPHKTIYNRFIFWQQRMRGALSQLPMASGPWIWRPTGGAETPAQTTLFDGLQP